MRGVSPAFFIFKYSGRRHTNMKKEIIFIDEDTLTPEEWEEIDDEQAEE